MLTTVYDFDPNDITIMIDTDDSYEQPTGGNIKVRSHQQSRFYDFASYGCC
jgi:hypothetical protein